MLHGLHRLTPRDLRRLQRSVAQLVQMISDAGIDVRTAVRKRESLYTELNLADASDDETRDAVYHEPDERRLTRDAFIAPFRRLLLDGAADGTLRAVGDADEVATVLYNQGQGGWPMSVFLTPDRKPFFAGTYFPPESRWGDGWCCHASVVSRPGAA